MTEPPLLPAETVKAAPAAFLATDLADLALDLWRLRARAGALPESAEAGRVLAACERAENRLERLGFELVVLEGPFDQNARARVVDHEPAQGPLRVSACLSPAVYYGGILVREAEVVTSGGETASSENNIDGGNG